MELDCDRRVLRRGAPARRYGELLLKVGCQPFSNPSAVTALARSPSLLERRLNNMRKRSLRRSLPIALVAGIVGVGLTVLACEADTPTAADPEVASGAPTEALESTQPEAGPGILAPLLYVDGELRGRLHSPAFGPFTSDDSEAERSGPLTSLEPGDVARIEVLKGEAARVLYGRDAEGGVIRVITRDGEDRAPAQSQGAVVTPEQQASGRALVLRDLARSGPAPLVVVDGIIVDPEHADRIDPADIESIEVIRGEAASRLFGSRGEHGVVQITTNRSSEPR
jgi:PAS domain-containing protein